ncbi:ABC transporter ATP-binding protein [Limnoglobus roseus]|uniref:ABC transporter ATP-binding protein n=1 Tax=Limnoglobus roseus TaxID=2598579 RepID=A0A5C1AEI0_9BACT|nr:ABC transporter ATP-binding protein [Limnoglobus roseus]QEL16995.1 ABC transporter ATP-binding protein [Limnoglobus roseus]
MSDEVAISIDRLVVRYRGKPAVNGLTLHVPKGSVFALLGDNGAGKSTTMKVLAGLVPPHAGRADILGFDCWSRAYELRHRVGYVPEKPRFYDWMTVANVGWFTASFHRRGFLEHYEQWVGKLGLDRTKRLKELSKGGYARVGLALALAADPQVLLLDEPTSGLDLLTRRDFLATLVELAAEGRTILISSHSISELERFTSHAAFVQEGRVTLSATIDDLRARFRRISFRAAGVSVDLSTVGKVLQSQRIGKYVQHLLQEPDADGLAMLCDNPLVSDYEETAVGLEDVYAALMAKPEDRRLPAPLRQRSEDELENQLSQEGV